MVAGAVRITRISETIRYALPTQVFCPWASRGIWHGVCNAYGGLATPGGRVGCRDPRVLGVRGVVWGGAATRMPSIGR